MRRRRSRRKIPALVLAALLLTSVVSQAKTGGLQGGWKIPDKPIVVTIKRVSDVYEGVVTQAPKHKAVGKKLLRNLRWDAKTGGFRGQIFVPKRGKTYPVFVKTKGARQLALTIDAGFISKTVVWTRR